MTTGYNSRSDAGLNCVDAVPALAPPHLKMSWQLSCMLETVVIIVTAGQYPEVVNNGCSEGTFRFDGATARVKTLVNAM